MLLSLIAYLTLLVVLINWGRRAYNAFFAFVWPNIFGPKNLTRKYGSWAVVTGSTDGIGLAYAKELARRKMNLVLISRTLEKLEKVAQEIRESFKVDVKFIVIDFAKQDDAVIYDKIKQGLDDICVAILVNNVGIGPPTICPFIDADEQDTRNQIKVNMGAMLTLTRYVYPRMRKANRGLIVNISSITEFFILPGVNIYSATKAFVSNFTKCLQIENSKYNCHVDIQLLTPGFVRTTLVSTAGLGMFGFPEADVYVNSAINTIGLVEYTTGYWQHELGAFIWTLMPRWLQLKLLLHTSAILEKSIAESQKINENKVD